MSSLSLALNEKAREPADPDIRHASSETPGEDGPATTDDDDDSDGDYDGHRPSLREIRSRRSGRSGSGSRSRRRPSTAGNGAAASISVSTGKNRTDLARPMSRTDTVLSRLRSRQPVQFTHPLSHVRTSKDDLVDFDGPDDPYKPINWPLGKKVTATMLYGLTTMTATWASSCYSAGTLQVAEQFGVGTQVATLGTSLFLVGFGLGPLLWAPLSEVYGRRVAVMAPMFVAIAFSFGSATAKDFQTLMITRFFAAFFASAPVTNTGGVLGDLFAPTERGIAIAGYAMAVVGGPILGPIVSAAVVAQPSLGWRWTEYLAGILQSFVLVLALVFIDETYPPLLLVYKARRLRVDSGNWALHARHEEWDVSIEELAHKFLLRPVQLLCTPICFLVALYASFCYGILYMQLGAVPIIFGEIRGWKPLVATLPFLAILIGAVIGAAINVYNQLHYNKAYRAAGNRAVPEQRLPPMMLGSVLFSAGQFVVGWTSSPSVHWIAPCLGLVMLGTGFFTIFQAALNYLVDTFTMYAASAVAANTFLRSAFASAFPLVVMPLYHNIGVGPGSSITGGFAVLLVPVPFVFFVYGKRIRAASKWSKASVYD
ncbi:major facilitator superfamily domain-containing protein [Lasiosphaeria miniovina]|uniref:Major facilitator superfamily domain-containing protein n=1 Tax=Lasiosphaeria miniovina TaxID=1954250 RepID=A0AA40ACN2_9PEZI|nr:major facilitator superfamily domain-containing protein [Lasiosphaeria miniovina]KAK0713263.1 major facilitator superfamily domain-containing protein [Lasiosphaeria miniovina]